MNTHLWAVLFSLVTCAPSVVNGQSLREPTSDFVATLEELHPGDFLTADNPRLHAGGYLYRFTLPVDSESILLFVASSLDCGEAGCYWTVFHASQDRHVRKVKTGLFLPSSAIFKSESEGRTTYQALMLGGREGSAIESFALDHAGSLTLTSRQLTSQEINVLSESSTERPKDGTLQSAFDFVESLRKRVVHLQYEEIKLSEYLENVDAAWAPAQEPLRGPEQAHAHDALAGRDSHESASDSDSDGTDATPQDVVPIASPTPDPEPPR